MPKWSWKMVTHPAFCVRKPVCGSDLQPRKRWEDRRGYHQWDARQRTSDGAEVWLQAEIMQALWKRTAMGRGTERSLNSNSQTRSHAWWDAEREGIHLVTKPCCLAGSIWALELARPKFHSMSGSHYFKYPQVKWWKKPSSENTCESSIEKFLPMKYTQKMLPLATFLKTMVLSASWEQRVRKETWCKDFCTDL